MAVSSDRHWVCCGSSLGYLSILDLRFQGREVAIWKVPCNRQLQSSRSLHPIVDNGVHRLATCYTRLPEDEGYNPYVVAAAGGAGYADSSVYNVESGAVKRCFRRINYKEWSCGNRRWMEPPKNLERVDINNVKFDEGNYLTATVAQDKGLRKREDTVRAIMGRISDSGRSFLITGGTDRSINFWDFRDPERCYNVSCTNKNSSNSNRKGGGEGGEEIVRSYGERREMFVSVESEEECGEGTGEVARGYKNNFSSNNVVKRADNSHRGVITDLKIFERPIRGFISTGGDGVVKVWR